MHKSKKQVRNFSYNQGESALNGSLVLLMLGGVGVISLVFMVFLLINISVNTSLKAKHDEISNLNKIKQIQENEISKLAKELNLTDKDLKDRIKTNKYLSSTLEKEKQQKESIKDSLSSLKTEHSKTVESFESSEKSAQELFLELQLEQEQLSVLQSEHDELSDKYQVVNNQKDELILENGSLNSELSKQQQQFSNLQDKHLQDISHIEELEKNAINMIATNANLEKLNASQELMIRGLREKLEVLTVSDQ